MSPHLYCVVLALCSAIVNVNADLNKNRSFINIQNPIPCVRRFNATHQIGCGKLDYGKYEGVAVAVRRSSEFKRLQLNFDKIKRKIVIITVPEMFDSVIDFYLDNTKANIINGIVLANKLNDVFNIKKPFSADKKNPNFQYSFYSNSSFRTDWNDAGKSYMFYNFEIPIYVITEQDQSRLPFEECYDKFNKIIFEREIFDIYSSDLLCGIQLGLEMYGSVSSTVCTRRQSIIHTVDFNTFCDPLGGSNYFSFLNQQPSNDLPIVMISSRIDTFTMYEYFTPGANEPISSIIGLLSVVELLSKYRNELDKNNVLFTLFDNEAFDYGGSSRFVNDLQLNQFPTISLSGGRKFKLSKDKLTTLIELNQLGSTGLDENPNLYIHYDPLTYGQNRTIQYIVDNYTNLLTTFSSNSIVELKNKNQQLPPSSIHSFLRHGLNIAGLLITDYDKNFKNQFYHSIFDTPESINVTFPENITEEEAAQYTTKFGERLQKFTTYVAQAVYYSSNSAKKNLTEQANQSTINKLIYCFYKNSTCAYFRSIMSADKWDAYTNNLNVYSPKGRLSFYTGVSDNAISGKWISTVLFIFFSRNTDASNFTVEECKSDSSKAKNLQERTNTSLNTFFYSRLNGCIASSLYSVSSVSPAFDKFDDGYLVSTEKFSAWTESSWSGDKIQMRLFMYTNESLKIITILLGTFVFLASIVLTYVTNKYSSEWFSVKNAEQTSELFE